MELMLESIREMIIYAIEFLIFLFVYNTFLEVKPRYKGIYIGIGLAYCFMIVAGEYYAYPLRNIIYYVYIFTTCFYLFNGKFILKLGILFLSLYLDLILEETLIIGVSFILQKDYAVVSESKLLAQVVVQYIKFIILVGFSRVYKLYIKKNPQVYEPFRWDSDDITYYIAYFKLYHISNFLRDLYCELNENGSTHYGKCSDVLLIGI